MLTPSDAVEAPTVMTFQSERLAGYTRFVSRFPESLPAATTTRTSWAAA